MQSRSTRTYREDLGYGRYPDMVHGIRNPGSRLSPDGFLGIGAPAFLVFADESSGGFNYARPLLIFNERKAPRPPIEHSGLALLTIGLR